MPGVTQGSGSTMKWKRIRTKIHIHASLLPIVSYQSQPKVQYFTQAVSGPTTSSPSSYIHFPFRHFPDYHECPIQDASVYEEYASYYQLDANAPKQSSCAERTMSQRTSAPGRYLVIRGQMDWSARRERVGRRIFLHLDPHRGPFRSSTRFVVTDQNLPLFRNRSGFPCLVVH